MAYVITLTDVFDVSVIDGSCGNPDLCCSGRNDGCHRLNCYCDVACLRLRDCCPDFTPTCLTGTCSEPTLCCSGLNYNCFRGCFCDEACQQLNDCCPDINNTCNPPVNFTTAPPFISTADPTFDSTSAPPFISTADPTFDSTSDPTFDSTVDPTFDSTSDPTFDSTSDPPFDSTAAPPQDGSCGNPDLCCSGLNNSCHRLNCYCDVACLRLHDCCPDFKHTCLSGKCSHPSLCCSGVNYDCFRGCFCDEACQQLNDCCPDLNSTCIFNPTTTAPPVNFTTAPPFTSTANPPVISTAAPTLDVLTLLTNLEVEVLAEESSTEEERQAALRQVGALLESYLRENNTDIYSFEVTRIQPTELCGSIPPLCSLTLVTSNPSNVGSIPVTTRPGVTNATTTTTTTTQAPVYGSCGNPDLCCSGLNNSCNRLNCYCDVACLRLRDCCPDFTPTCLTGKCSEPTLCCSGLNYNCFRGCFCDENCKQFNDCCPDINSTCNVPTVLTVLEARVLTKSASSEEERQAVMRQVGALLGNLLGVNNTDIISLKVTRIKPVSSPYD
ncbi:Proteoglycan 4 [Anabarilius grahami]|uniref:Proteoglycan 4 n=1 Tax=Anabarilius grahami TaxID=495550 RepID=A0A3N0XL97_ANAGA|nr:Proteoglycan 4 [Anabarilius grahami]